MPKVSIIIPVYNQERFVREAIESALAQTYQDYELIVVDDGSTDDSRDVIRTFGDRLRCISQENRGLGGARNTGILAAQGEWIGLLDADDQWQPDFLEKMLALAGQHPKEAILYCSAQGMDSQGRELPERFGWLDISPGSFYQQLLRANFLIPSTILLRRSVLQEAGLFEEKDRAIHGCEDWDLWLRLAPDHTFVGTSDCLVRYRLHESSLSADPSGMQRAARAVIEKNFGSEEGEPGSWSKEKRRAYGGLYRFHVLTSIQRQNNWETAGIYLGKALQADPTLSLDLDLFYELAQGYQSTGYRGSSHSLNIASNAKQVHRMLAMTLPSSNASELESLRRQTFGTANYAIGLIAYIHGEGSLTRHHLIKAIRSRPELACDLRLLGLLPKSLFGQSVIQKLKVFSIRKDSKIRINENSPN